MHPLIKRRDVLLSSMLPFFFYYGAVSAGEKYFSRIDLFRKHVMERLLARQDVSEVKPDDKDPAILRMTYKDKTWTLDLTNTFQRLDAYPGENVETTIERLLAQLAPDAKRTLSEDNLVVVLRSRAYVDLLAQKGANMRHEPLAGDLHMVLMADLPEAMSPLHDDEMNHKDVTEAKRNVSKWLTNVITFNQIPGVEGYSVKGNEFLTPSLVLLDDFWSSVDRAMAHEPLIVVASYDQLYLRDSSNPQADDIALKLIEFTYQDGFNLLSDKVYQCRNGQIVPR
ncbi:hypothetical protein [Aminobacter sp. AP02]|uniref:hypothetical protein n=1 Tax=Aminobacter sp. AP02 TaxID=2135737 RepID=UPI000D6D9DFA|nr:hypothetical protein [Aminobacter sp. AP02]PWK75695.1 hypothetical protein C8K44_103264 [Aminobacter sp. AP02]